MAKLLQPGTVCLLRSKDLPVYSGMVLVVERFDARLDAYDCSPPTPDPVDGLQISWERSALYPMDGGPGQDEMLRITGKPKKTRRAKRQEVSHG